MNTNRSLNQHLFLYIEEQKLLYTISASKSPSLSQNNSTSDTSASKSPSQCKPYSNTSPLCKNSWASTFFCHIRSLFTLQEQLGIYIFCHIRSNVLPPDLLMGTGIAVALQMSTPPQSMCMIILPESEQSLKTLIFTH